jgi:hypothetical protein
MTRQDRSNHSDQSAKRETGIPPAPFPFSKYRNIPERDLSEQTHVDGRTEELMSQSTLPDAVEITNDDETPEDCDCEHLNPERLPCWDCVLNGRKEIPEVAGR